VIFESVFALIPFQQAHRLTYDKVETMFFFHLELSFAKIMQPIATDDPVAWCVCLFVAAPVTDVAEVCKNG